MVCCLLCLSGQVDLVPVQHADKTIFFGMALANRRAMVIALTFRIYISKLWLFSLRINFDEFLRIFLELSEAFLRTSQRLFEDFLRNFRGILEDLVVG